MRPIDADDVKRLILEDGLYCDTEADKEYSASIIDTIPTADVVEVVRCKDCKWLSYFDDEEVSYWCGVWANETDEDCFCKWGERRADDATD